jgi:hypothetical protein
MGGCMIGRRPTNGTTVGHRVEQPLGRLAAHNEVGDRVSVPLVRIAAPPDAAVEPHTVALLYDVCGLVRGLAEVRGRGERDVIAGRVGARADRGGRVRGLAADVGTNPRDVVVAEAVLDRRRMRQALALTRDAALGGLVDRRRVAGHSPVSVDRRTGAVRCGRSPRSRRRGVLGVLGVHGARGVGVYRRLHVARLSLQETRPDRMLGLVQAGAATRLAGLDRVVVGVRKVRGRRARATLFMLVVHGFSYAIVPVVDSLPSSANSSATARSRWC